MRAVAKGARTLPVSLMSQAPKMGPRAKPPNSKPPRMEKTRALCDRSVSEGDLGEAREIHLDPLSVQSAK